MGATQARPALTPRTLSRSDVSFPGRYQSLVQAAPRRDDSAGSFGRTVQAAALLLCLLALVSLGAAVSHVARRWGPMPPLASLRTRQARMRAGESLVEEDPSMPAAWDVVVTETTTARTTVQVVSTAAPPTSTKTKAPLVSLPTIALPFVAPVPPVTLAPPSLPILPTATVAPLATTAKPASPTTAKPTVASPPALPTIPTPSAPHKKIPALPTIPTPSTAHKETPKTPTLPTIPTPSAGHSETPKAPTLPTIPTPSAGHKETPKTPTLPTIPTPSTGHKDTPPATHKDTPQETPTLPTIPTPPVADKDTPKATATPPTLPTIPTPSAGHKETPKTATLPTIPTPSAGHKEDTPKETPTLPTIPTPSLPHKTPTLPTLPKQTLTLTLPTIPTPPAPSKEVSLTLPTLPKETPTLPTIPIPSMPATPSLPTIPTPSIPDETPTLPVISAPLLPSLPTITNPSAPEKVATNAAGSPAAPAAIAAETPTNTVQAVLAELAATTSTLETSSEPASTTSPTTSTAATTTATKTTQTTSTTTETSTVTATTLTTTTTSKPVVRSVNPFTTLHKKGKKSQFQWIGCYERGSLGNMASLALSTEACAKSCPGFSYVALGSQGWCMCVDQYPTPPTFSREVPDHDCGKVCTNETDLVPTRYCGDFDTSAVYWVNTTVAQHVVASKEVSKVGSEPSATEGNESSNATGAGASLRPPASPANSTELLGKAFKRRSILKGISYVPMPLQEADGSLPPAGFSNAPVAPLWGKRGRGDLQVIRSLGANAVRLYGNDLAGDQRSFLDEAQAQGLEVIVGISDGPYTGKRAGCGDGNNYTCYRQIKDLYLRMLKSGFLLANKSYHPALRAIVVANDPDIMFSPITEHWRWCKVVVSAVDGIIDAEHAAGVVGPRLNITAALSFGLCGRTCREFPETPAVGQMVELRHAFKTPEEVGYQPQNHLWHAYNERFENSVNTKNPEEGRDGVRQLFLGAYQRAFNETPVFLAEYHTPEVSGAPWASKVDLGKDLTAVVEAAKEPGSMLSGVVFHEFQVRYDKGGEQLAFGLFGLGDRAIGSFAVGSTNFTSWCLSPMGLPTEVSSCGLTEGGVDYSVETSWLFHLEDVPTPSLCCAKCTELPRCKSWTWLEDAGVEGCSGEALAMLPAAGPAGRLKRRLGGLPRAPCCDVLQADAGGQTCGERISRHVNATGESFAAARTVIAKQHHSCEACAEPARSRCWLRGATPHGKTPMDGVVSGYPVPVPEPAKLGTLMPAIVAEAFGGPGLPSDDPRLCPASRVQFLAPKSLVR